jgi:hypothetical protein
VSNQWKPELTVTFNSEFLQLPVVAGEVQLIWSYIDEVLAKMPQHDEEG